MKDLSMDLFGCESLSASYEGTETTERTCFGTGRLLHTLNLNDSTREKIDVVGQRDGVKKPTANTEVYTNCCLWTVEGEPCVGFILQLWLGAPIRSDSHTPSRSTIKK